MSSPISSVNEARLPGLQRISSTSAGNGGASSSQSGGLEVGQTGIGQMQEVQENFTMLQSVVLQTVTTANLSQFEGAFGQILQTASTVDPATGQREMTAAANSELSGALQKLLVESGFTTQQAEAASASFGEQLAKGGTVSLNASFAVTSESSFSVSGFTKAIAGNIAVSAGYGTTLSASGTIVSSRAGSVSITFDPDSGALSVSLESQQVSATSSVIGVAASATRAISPPSGDTKTAAPEHGVDGHSGDAGARGGAPRARSTRDTASSGLPDLVAGLGHPTLHGLAEALDLLSRAADAAQTESVPTDTGAGPGNRARNRDGARPVAVTVGFTQPLSIASHSVNGHRAALFRRADGSTGAVSFSPTNVEA
ncbi:MAG TPA: hypothetical protein VGN31_05255 [Paraburkholderia sp.]|jgi:hypothetical protein